MKLTFLGRAGAIALALFFGSISQTTAQIADTYQHGGAPDPDWSRVGGEADTVLLDDGPGGDLAGFAYQMATLGGGSAGITSVLVDAAAFNAVATVDSTVRFKIYSDAAGEVGALMGTSTDVVLQDEPAAAANGNRVQNLQIDLNTPIDNSSAGNLFWISFQHVSGGDGIWRWTDNVFDNQSDAADSITGGEPDWSGAAGSFPDIAVSITAVPEPHEYAMFAGVLLLIFGGWRHVKRVRTVQV